MKTENTSIRLKKIMGERNLRQVDILKMVEPYCERYGIKMNKSDISQYVSGKNEPGQDKLVMLGMALQVCEAWLMGYDVPMMRCEYEENTYENLDIFQYFNKLNKTGKGIATEQVRLLTLDKKYTKTTSIVKEPFADYLTPNAAREKEGTKSADQEYDNRELMDNDELWKK